MVSSGFRNCRDMTLIIDGFSIIKVMSLSFKVLQITILGHHLLIYLPGFLDL